MKNLYTLLLLLTFGIFFQMPLMARSPIPPQIAAPQRTADTLVPREDFEALGFFTPDEPFPLVEAEIYSFDNQLHTLSEYQGGVTALNLWATWCPPCREEMPSMQRLYNILDRDLFAILAVATPNPPRETREGIIQFVREYNYTFPVLLDTDYQVTSIYGTGSVPSTWIIDKRGNVRALMVGAFEWDTPEMISLFQRLMQE